MEKAGWLSATNEIQEKRPNKKVFALTPTGKEALDDWLADFDEAIAAALHVRSSFLMRMFFAGERPLNKTIKALKSFREQNQKALTALAQVPDRVAKYGSLVPEERKRAFWSLVASFGDNYYRAAIEWANQALDQLEKS
jgi:hypothetical protein